MDKINIFLKNYNKIKAIAIEYAKKIFDIVKSALSELKSERYGHIAEFLDENLTKETELIEFFRNLYNGIKSGDSVFLEFANAFLSNPKIDQLFMLLTQNKDKETKEPEPLFKEEKIANAKEAWQYISYATHIRKEVKPGARYEKVWKILANDPNPLYLVMHHALNLEEPIENKELEKKALSKLLAMNLQEPVMFYYSKFHPDNEMRLKLQSYLSKQYEMEPYVKEHQDLIYDPEFFVKKHDELAKKLYDVLKTNNIYKISEFIESNIHQLSVYLNSRYMVGRVDDITLDILEQRQRTAYQHLLNIYQYYKNYIEEKKDLLEDKGIEDINNAIDIISELMQAIMPIDAAIDALKSESKPKYEKLKSEDVINVNAIIYGRIDQEKALEYIEQLDKNNKIDWLVYIFVYRLDLFLAYAQDKKVFDLADKLGVENLCKIFKSYRNEYEKSQLAKIAKQIANNINHPNFEKLALCFIEFFDQQEFVDLLNKVKNPTIKTKLIEQAKNLGFDVSGLMPDVSKKPEAESTMGGQTNYYSPTTYASYHGGNMHLKIIAAKKFFEFKKDFLTNWDLYSYEEFKDKLDSFKHIPILRAMFLKSLLKNSNEKIKLFANYYLNNDLRRVAQVEKEPEEEFAEMYEFPEKYRLEPPKKAKPKYIGEAEEISDEFEFYEEYEYPIEEELEEKKEKEKLYEEKKERERWHDIYELREKNFGFEGYKTFEESLFDKVKEASKEFEKIILNYFENKNNVIKFIDFIANNYITAKTIPTLSLGLRSKPEADVILNDFAKAITEKFLEILAIYSKVDPYIRENLIKLATDVFKSLDVPVSSISEEIFKDIVNQITQLYGINITKHYALDNQVDVIALNIIRYAEIPIQSKIKKQLEQIAGPYLSEKYGIKFEDFEEKLKSQISVKVREEDEVIPIDKKRTEIINKIESAINEINAIYNTIDSKFQPHVAEIFDMLEYEYFKSVYSDISYLELPRFNAILYILLEPIHIKKFQRIKDKVYARLRNRFKDHKLVENFINKIREQVKGKIGDTIDKIINMYNLCLYIDNLHKELDKLQRL